MRKKFLIIIFLNVAVSMLFISGFIDIKSVESILVGDDVPNILLLQKDEKLIVIKADKKLTWSDVGIQKGRCKLPSGPIQAGDYINQCSGELVLEWIPSDSIMGQWTFS